MDKKELINGIKEVLNLNIFKAVSKGAGAVSLVHENKAIIFGYNKYPNIYVLGPSLISYISFPEVEDILEPYYKKYGLGYQPYTIYKSSRRFEHLSSIDLFTPDDIQKVGSELRTMVYEDILPFFEDYKNLSTVIEHMQSLAKEEVSKFICHSPVPRIMVLKKNGNTTDWLDFCEWAVETYKSMALGPNGMQYEAESKLIIELNEKLKSI